MVNRVNGDRLRVSPRIQIQLVLARSSGKVHLIFGMRASENVRAKGCRVNSVFLVQLRKILDADFDEVEGVDNFAGNTVQGACKAVIGLDKSAKIEFGANGVTGCPQRLHRKYRKAVNSVPISLCFPRSRRTMRARVVRIPVELRLWLRSDQRLEPARELRSDYERG